MSRRRIVERVVEPRAKSHAAAMRSQSSRFEVSELIVHSLPRHIDVFRMERELTGQLNVSSDVRRASSGIRETAWRLWRTQMSEDPVGLLPSKERHHARLELACQLLTLAPRCRTHCRHLADRFLEKGLLIQ